MVTDSFVDKFLKVSREKKNENKAKLGVPWEKCEECMHWDSSQMPLLVDSEGHEGHRPAQALASTTPSAPSQELPSCLHLRITQAY